MQPDQIRGRGLDKFVPGPFGMLPEPNGQRASARSQRGLTPETRAALPLLPRRLGRYTLFDHIGRGGMADIFLAQAATDFGGSRLLVIKEVLPALADSPEFAALLVSEAKLAAQLCHANVVQVEDLGRHNGALYIAMEYVEGLDLREMLRRCAKQKVGLPVEFSLRIVIEALKGLSYAHRARDEHGEKLGIVHRDVSPSNVLLSFEGEVKLCDFGIARAAPLTATSDEEPIVGKAGYMSPEQARGERLDARSDVFAAGIILWELLAGRRLYKARASESLIDLARRAVIPPLPSRGLRREEVLTGIVERALEPCRDARYSSAAEMLHDLEEYAVSARMVANPIRFGEWLKDSFGAEVLAARRGRALVMRALALGPVAVIEPIASESRPPELEEARTPSAFPVALPEASEDPAIEACAYDDIGDRLALVPPIDVALEAATERAPAAEARAFTWALAVAAAVFASLWFFATH